MCLILMDIYNKSAISKKKFIKMKNWLLIINNKIPMLVYYCSKNNCKIIKQIIIKIQDHFRIW